MARIVPPTSQRIVGGAGGAAQQGEPDRGLQTPERRGMPRSRCGRGRRRAGRGGRADASPGCGARCGGRPGPGPGSSVRRAPGAGCSTAPIHRRWAVPDGAPARTSSVCQTTASATRGATAPRARRHMPPALDPAALPSPSTALRPSAVRSPGGSAGGLTRPHISSIGSSSSSGPTGGRARTHAPKAFVPVARLPLAPKHPDDPAPVDPGQMAGTAVSLPRPFVPWPELIALARHRALRLSKVRSEIDSCGFSQWFISPLRWCSLSP